MLLEGEVEQDLNILHLWVFSIITSRDLEFAR